MAHQSCLVLGPNGQAFIPLPFQNVSLPGKGVPWLRILSAAGVVLGGADSIPSSSAIQPITEGGSGRRGYMSTINSYHLRSTFYVAGLCWGMFTFIVWHNSHSTLRYRLCFAFYMRKLGLCLFFCMKTQHGAIFHRWPTTWNSLLAYVEEESQVFIGKCQKFGFDVLLLTSSCTLG